MLGFLGRLLPYTTGQSLGKILGGWTYYVLKKERDKAVKHIKTAFTKEFTDGQAEDIARACFEHLGMCLFEVFKLPVMVKKGIGNYVTAEGLENVIKAKDLNRGVILITGHIGNWELLGSYLARKGSMFTVIARENSNPHLSRLQQYYRDAAGFKTILRGGISTVKESIRILKRGELLGMLVDQHTRVDSVRVPFFGMPAYTPVGPFTFAMRTGSPIIFTTIHRLPDGKHRAMFSEPLELVVTDNKERDLEMNAGIVNRLYEDTIRKYPSQWVWMHRRWRD
jgi:KDO2-lipid IV(A) lauroyltransferase